MQRKIPAFATAAPATVATSTQSTVVTTRQQKEEEKKEPVQDKVMTEKEDKEGKGGIHCDARTSCPERTTCCFMVSSKKWGCCPLPEVNTASLHH